MRSDRLFLRRKVETSARIVVVDYIAECSETAIVVETSLLVVIQSRERRRSIDLVSCAVRLEVVDAYLCWSMRVPTRLGE